MTDAEPPSTSQPKGYFELKPEELPLFKLRQLVVHWVLPFNNLFLLCSTLGINAAVAGLADLATPKLRLFPWLTSGALLLTVLCMVLQTGLRPAWTAGARKHPLGRLLLRPTIGSFSAVLLLLSVAGASWAQTHPGGRGVLAAHSATLQSLQEVLLDLRANVAAVQSGVNAANGKLDRLGAAQAAAQAEDVSRRTRAAARPDSLGLLSLSQLPAAASAPSTLQLHLAVYVNAPGLALQQARLRLQTRDIISSAAWTSRDLSPQLSGASEQQTLQFSVPNAVRELRLCLDAPYPDVAHPHTLMNEYRLDPGRGDQAIQPAGPAELVPSDGVPCGP